MNPNDSIPDRANAAPDKSNDNEAKHKKRGMKPRSKRNRKKPKSELRNGGEIKFDAKVVSIEFDGEAVVGSPTPWMRMVDPYPYTFATFAKARWVGRTVLEVYATEFGSYPKSYYASAILQGRILVNDAKVGVEYVIRGQDSFSHTIHRHEPGVAVHSEHAPHINVVCETDEVLVVDKPGTLPVHPCGGYHVQSLMSILEPKFGKLYTIHRLDRLTGGLVILGKKSDVAQEWGKAIMSRNCSKVYLARVKGRFPTNCDPSLPQWSEDKALPESGCIIINEADEESKTKICDKKLPIDRETVAYGYWCTDGSGKIRGDVKLLDIAESAYSVESWLDESTRSPDQVSNMKMLHVAVPTRIANPKDGVCEAGEFRDLDEAVYIKTVKPAQTSFSVVQYDEMSDSTIVLCRPATGRTHQLRLHLQHLGHPIANDPNYGGKLWYNNPKREEIATKAKSILDGSAPNQTGADEVDPKKATGPSPHAIIDIPATEDEIESMISEAVQKEGESDNDFIKRTCIWCARCRMAGTDRTMLEFLIRSSGIWLHALEYTFHGLSVGSRSYRAPMPPWSNFDQA